ncbi:hypothetical protein GGS21DRAFT_486458 [Xylaria nigripes]|nr:hypothetical protein GGS21DRAFT_486458 [Xylaria nigripes]
MSTTVAGSAYSCDCTLPKWPAKKRPQCSRKKKDDGPPPTRVDQLVALGWTREGSYVSEKVTATGKVVFEGYLRVGELEMCGEFAISGEIQCRGRFTLSGALECWSKPAVVETLFIDQNAVIHGDIVVNGNATIKGNCIVYGRLTITKGTLRLDSAVLQCKSLDVTGVIEKVGEGSTFTAEDELVINGEDLNMNERFRILAAYVYGQP